MTFTCSSFGFIKNKNTGTTVKQKHITLSVLIHAAVLTVFLLASGFFIKGDNLISDENVLTVSISGDPDKKIGDTHTKGYEASATEDEITPGQSGGTGHNAKNSYSGMVLKKIYENKYYPLAARKQNLSGKVTLSFTLDRSGAIIGLISNTRSSGSNILDDSAINAVKNSQPFEEFPDNIKDKELTFTVDMDFVP
ncbi:MAG: TonB family protein [Pseudomonadota bacterium]